MTPSPSTLTTSQYDLEKKQARYEKLRKYFKVLNDADLPDSSAESKELMEKLIKALNKSSIDDNCSKQWEIMCLSSRQLAETLAKVSFVAMWRWWRMLPSHIAHTLLFI